MSERFPVLSLMFLFMKTGIQTFGGGYGILPILQKEFVDDRNWITSEELLDYYALGQCTPGIIAVNVATLVGYKRCGLAGALAATAGFVFPSFIIILIIASVLQEVASLEIVSHIFAGIRLAVCALIFHTVLILRKTAVVDTTGIAVFVFFFIASAVFSLSPMISVIAAVVCGLLLRKVSKREEAEKKRKEKEDADRERDGEPEKEDGMKSDGEPEKGDGMKSDGEPEKEDGTKSDGEPKKEDGTKSDGEPETADAPGTGSGDLRQEGRQ